MVIQPPTNTEAAAVAPSGTPSPGPRDLDAAPGGVAARAGIGAEAAAGQVQVGGAARRPRG